MPRPVILIFSPELADYGFPDGHPFGRDRLGAFMGEMQRSQRFADCTVRAAAARDACRDRVFPRRGLCRPRHRAFDARQRTARHGRHACVPRSLRGSRARSRRHARGAGGHRERTAPARVHSDRRPASCGARHRCGILCVQRLCGRDRSRTPGTRPAVHRLRRHRCPPRRRRLLRLRARSRRAVRGST